MVFLLNIAALSILWNPGSGLVPEQWHPLGQHINVYPSSGRALWAVPPWNPSCSSAHVAATWLLPWYAATVTFPDGKQENAGEVWVSWSEWWAAGGQWFCFVCALCNAMEYWAMAKGLRYYCTQVIILSWLYGRHLMLQNIGSYLWFY